MAIKVGRQDIKWGYLSQILNSGINILLLPFVLKMLSTEKLGLWYNFTAIGALVMLLDFGFSGTMTRNIAYAWSGAKEILKEGFIGIDGEHKPNLSLFSKVYCVSKRVYLVIATTALVLLLTIGTFYIIKITDGSIEKLEYLPAWFIYVTAIFINIYYAYWNPILRGIGAVKEYYQVLFITKIVQLIISIIGLILGYQLLAVSLAYLFSAIFGRLVSNKFFYNYEQVKENIELIRNYKANPREIRNIFITLWSSIYKQGILSISNYMIEKASFIIVTLYFGLESSSSYGLTLQAFGVVTTIGNVMYNSYLPAIIKYKTTNELEKAYKLLCKSISVQCFFIVIGYLGIVFLGHPLLKLIKSQTLLISNENLFFLFVYLLIFNFQTICTNYIIMENKYPMLKSYIVTGLITVLVSVILSSKFRTNGIGVVIITQLCVLLLYNSWKWPKEVANSHGKSMLDLIKDCFNVKTNLRR